MAKRLSLSFGASTPSDLDCSPDGIGIFVSFESSSNAGFGEFVAVLELGGNDRVGLSKEKAGVVPVGTMSKAE